MGPSPHRVQEPSPTWRYGPGKDHGVPNKDALGILLRTNLLLIPILPQYGAADRQPDNRTDGGFWSSVCLCNQGSFQLSLELLAKSHHHRVSAGAGGALPPLFLVHSQLLGTEEEKGSSRKQQCCWHLLVTEKQEQKNKTAKAGARQEQSKDGLSSPGEGRAVGCQRCMTPAQQQEWVHEEGSAEDRLAISASAHCHNSHCSVASQAPSPLHPGGSSALIFPPASQLPGLRNRLEIQSQLQKAAAISWKEGPSLESGKSTQEPPGHMPEGTCGHHLLLWDGLIFSHDIVPVTLMTEGDVRK